MHIVRAALGLFSLLYPLALRIVVVAVAKAIDLWIYELVSFVL